jgi:hypothetical protein
VTPDTALAKKPPNPGGGGGGATTDTVYYQVWFSADVWQVYYFDPDPLRGRVERIDSQHLLVNINAGGTGNPAVRPKNLLFDPQLELLEGTTQEHFDVAFPNEPYSGTLTVSADGSMVSMGFTALSRSGKKQGYRLIASVLERNPADWQPLLMKPGEQQTLTLGEWELRADVGGTAKAVHARGNFDDGDVSTPVGVQITIERE